MKKSEEMTFEEKVNDIFNNNSLDQILEKYDVEDENINLEDMDEKRIENSHNQKKNLDTIQKNISQYVKSAISLDLISIIKQNEKDFSRKVNRFILICGFITILLGIPFFVYKFLYNYYFVYKLSENSYKYWVDIFLILLSCWKLINLSLTKIVDYVFLVDKQLINTMMDLVKLDHASNNNITTRSESELSDDFITCYLKWILNRRTKKEPKN